jgi:integrase/recombinase XerC
MTKTKPKLRSATQNTLADFHASLQAAHRSERTVTGYTQDLALFARWFEQTNAKRLTPQALTSSDVGEYKQRLKIEKAAPATINRRLAALRAYVSWAQGKGLIDHNPIKNIEGVEEQKVAPKWLDKQQQARLLHEVEVAVNAARTDAGKRQALRDQAIIVLLLNTGLRISELCALELGDVILTDRKGEVRVRSGKGEKARTVPCNKLARAALRTWLEVREEVDSEYLFTSKRSAVLTPSAVERRLTELGRRAKVEVTPHTLRHTLAKNLMNAEVSIEKVAALLGHSNLNTTRLYTTPSQADLDQTVTVLED